MVLLMVSVVWQSPDTINRRPKDTTVKKDALSDVFVRTVKKPGKHVDGRGLYLLVTALSDGQVGKLWRMNFRHAGKCRDSCDHWPIRSWPLLQARQVMREVVNTTPKSTP